MKPFRTALLLLLLSALPVTPCDAQETLRIAAFESEAFVYRGEDGQPAGLEFEIIERVAKAGQMEVEVTWIDSFDDLIPGPLERGEADIAVGSLSITAERLTKVDFSESYFPVRVVLVEARGSTTRSLDDLRGSRLATMAATTYEDILSAVPDHSFVYTQDERGLFEAVASGDADALACDSGIGLYLLSEYPSLEITLEISEEQRLGFAFRKDSPLLEQFDRHLSLLLRSPTYYTLLEKYLGAKAVEIVEAGRND